MTDFEHYAGSSTGTSGRAPSTVGEGLARAFDPATSKEAAKLVDKAAGCSRYYQAVVDLGGDATNEEVAQHLGITQIGSVSPRAKALIAAGKLVDTGKTRRSSSGRPMRVLRAV